MRQTDLELVLAQGEYEVRSYFLCGASARQNNLDGTTMVVTNKRIVFEFMNYNELARREIPIDKIDFVKSHYYEEQEDSSYTDKYKKMGISSFVVAAILIIIGGLGISNVFNIFAMMGLSQFWIPIIPIGIGFISLIIGFTFISKSKKYKPRTGKKLELLIGTTLDLNSGVMFSADSTHSLRDNMRTYSGAHINTLVGKVHLSPTREAKKMINEIGALIIDIKAGLYNEDPEVKKARELEEKKKKEEEALIKRIEKNKQKNQDYEEFEEYEDLPPKKNKQKSIEDKMSKYGAPLEFEEYDNSMPRSIAMQFEKSKIKTPIKKKNKNKMEDDAELEEEYQAVLKSLNMN